MVFSSPVFIWVFLPSVLFIYHISGRKLKNPVLLISSLIFYAWGEPVYVLLMMFSIMTNYFAGLLIDRCKDQPVAKKLILIADIIINLSLLGYYKYFDFFTELINTVFHTGLEFRNISLPIGISFFTFQILSYIIDLYRGKYEVQRNPVSLALYISFFPQLIAGPIVQYESIRKQLDARTESLEKKAAGIRRFIYGLAKKVLIANTMARFVDTVYSTDSSFNGMISWLTAVAYMLQIYYDFSGYSDMAIGLGKMFGFEFSENFNYPYLSSSIHEFWQRWHISLGSWFREYLYFPLGGNRKGTVRTYYNLIIVFLLTGLWHGANMTFVLWGLFHVCFQIVERAGLTDILKRHRISAHIYTLLVVLFGWVLFRADTVSQALEIMKQMLLPWRYTYTSLLLPQVITHKFIVMMILGIAGMGLIQRPVRKISSTLPVSAAEYIYCMCILLLSMASLAGNTYNPFIYFRF